MPKRGGPRGNYNGSGSRFSSLKDYQNEHDDRGDNRAHKERNSTRRVSFKPSVLQNVGGIRRRTAELALRTRLEDDEDMGDFVELDRNHEGRRRKGSPIPKGRLHALNGLQKSPFGWYAITLPIRNINRYSKDDVIAALLRAIAPDIFIPHYYTTDKYGITFFVDDHEVAARLVLVGTIRMRDNHVINVRVRGMCPPVKMDEQLKQQMMVVMSQRYNQERGLLDLSAFHKSPEFKDVFCGLQKHVAMNVALEIIEKHIPNLVELNLSNNFLTHLDGMKNFGNRLPTVRKLNLSENNITSVVQLNALYKAPLAELCLRGNPIVSRYKDHAAYISDVRRKIPTLRFLDNESMGPTVHVEEEEDMPAPKASFLCDVNGTDIIRQFLEQYFQIFDSDNRQPLLDAYHEQAMLSISIPPASQAGRLNNFWKFNRNFRRIMNNEEAVKIRQLRVGRLAVVSTLAEWPKTKHESRTFSVDLTLFTPKLIAFTLAGHFLELDSKNPNHPGDLRYFQRQYVIVPAGSGFCIRNELIIVTSATPVQIRVFSAPRSASLPSTASATATLADSVQNRLQISQPGASTSAAAAAAMGNPTPALLQAGTIDEATKFKMVQAMSAQSNMNMEWSKKCLEETNWDYNHAAFVFDKLHKENKIPPEAFVK